MYGSFRLGESSGQRKATTSQAIPPVQEVAKESSPEVAPLPAVRTTQPAAQIVPVAQKIEDSEPVYLAKARKLVRKQNSTEALAILEKELAKGGDKAEIEAEIGKIYQRLDKPELAISHLQNSVRADPEQPDVLPDLVSSYVKSNHLQEGEQFLLEVSAQLHPTAPGPALAYADLKARQQQWGEAANFLEQRAATLSNPDEAYGAAGSLHLQGPNPNPVRAQRAFEQSMQIHRERGATNQANPSAVTRDVSGLVQAYLMQGKVDDAERTLNENSPLLSNQENRNTAEQLKGMIDSARMNPAAAE